MSPERNACPWKADLLMYLASKNTLFPRDLQGRKASCTFFYAISSHFIWLFFSFDIEGFVTGFGNPDWRRTHDPASRTAPAVRALVQAGATCVAKTHMDEMAYRY